MTFAWSRIADYVRAVAALGAEQDVSRQRAIAALFGLALERPIELPRLHPKPPGDPSWITSKVRQPEPEPEPRPIPAPPPAEPPPRSRRQVRRNITLTPTVVEQRTRPGWIEHVLPLEQPRATVTKPRAPMPLFPQRTSRAILSTAMAQDRETNAIDVDAVVRSIALGDRILRVPRRVVAGLSHGVQLLIDRGPSSEPFLADQDLVAEQIRVVAGRDRVQVLRFDPSRGFIAGTGPRIDWIDYFAIEPRALPGVTVVLLSDLGITNVPVETTASADDWRRFLDRIRARGNPVLAFVPYDRKRWPPALRELAVILTWDRRTSIQAVRSARR